MFKGIIYKYTSPSGKSYIGQTINEESRRRDFLNENQDYSGPKINKAREKYGVKNFEYIIIFKVESFIESEIKEILNEKEKQYIQLFDTFDNGYNSDLGGGSGTYTRTEENKKLLSEITTNYYKTNKSTVAKSVVQFDLFGNYIKTWESAREAAKSINKEGNSITNVCTGKRNHAYGFIWRYLSDFDEFENIPEKIEVKVPKDSAIPLRQYDLTGNFIKEWKTMSEAAEELGYSLGNFSTYCNGRNNHIYKGFIYCRGELNNIINKEE